MSYSLSVCMEVTGWPRGPFRARTVVVSSRLHHPYPPTPFLFQHFFLLFRSARMSDGRGT